MQVSSRGSRSRPAAASHSTLHTASHFTATMLRLLCLLAGLSATVTGACLAPFTLMGEGCYYFSKDYDIRLSWAEARQYCLNLGSDVDLAMMGSVRDDFNNLGIYYVLEGKVNGIWEPTWIGATGADDSWYWLDGCPFLTDSSYWTPERPTSSSGGVAMALHIDGTYFRMYLTELNAGFQHPFLCQDYSAVVKQ